MDNRQNNPACRSMIRGLSDRIQETMALVHVGSMASVFSEVNELKMLES
jgi:hypothetical protein